MKFHPLEFKLFNILNDAAHYWQNQEKNIHFVVLVSGGKDSIALLNALSVIINQTKIKLPWPKIEISVLHFNHNQRDKASDDDAMFVKNETLRRGYEFRLFLWNDDNNLFNKHGENFHNAAREWRYQSSEKYRSGLVSNQTDAVVVTAHHLDDLCESLLFNLIRGSGVGGLCGIRLIEETKFRPFANLPQSEILDYLTKQKIFFREDASNASTKYTRNKIRLELMPKIAEINPNYREALLHLSQSAFKSKSASGSPKVLPGQVVILPSAEMTPADLLSSVKQHSQMLAKKLTLNSAKNVLHHYHLFLMKMWKHPEFDWNSAEPTLVVLAKEWRVAITHQRLVFFCQQPDND